MATLQDPEVRELLEQPNYAVVSTMSEHGAIRSTIVWVSAEGNEVAVNSAVGRRWPTDLERDPRVTLLVFESGNPYHFVEIRGTATATLEGAEEHIDSLAKKYLGEDRYPYRTEGEQRVKFVITPEHVRHVRQG